MTLRSRLYILCFLGLSLLPTLLSSCNEANKTSVLFTATANIPTIEKQYPTATVNPIEDVEKEAGDGVIGWSIQMAFHPTFPIAVYNMWTSHSANLRVFAGNTADPNQGAVAIVPPYGDIYNPEIYVTINRVGGLEIIDAVGERLMLRSYRTNDLFFFDIPSRQYVASMNALSPVTVTPLPTFTPTSTFVVIPMPTTKSTPYPMIHSTPALGTAYP